MWGKFVDVFHPFALLFFVINDSRENDISLSNKFHFKVMCVEIFSRVIFTFTGVPLSDNIQHSAIFPPVYLCQLYVHTLETLVNW